MMNRFILVSILKKLINVCAGVTLVLILIYLSYPVSKRTIRYKQVLWSGVTDQAEFKTTAIQARESSVDDILAAKLENQDEDSEEEFHDLTLMTPQSAICPDALLGQPKSIRDIPDCPECEMVTCNRLFSSDNNDPVYNLSRMLMERHTRYFNVMTEDELVGLTKDCENFKMVRGYHLESSLEETEFPLAFTILAHQNLVQTEKLLRVIYRPHNVYCLHIDLTSNSLLDGMSHIVKCFDNVFVAFKLENVVYAGFSRLQADLNCLHDLLSSEVKWKYLLNTAATAFPLKTNLELVRTLKAYNGSNDIKTIKTIDNDYLQSRFKFRHEEKEELLYKTKVLHPPPSHNLTIVKGNAYAVFSRAFMEFVVEDQRARDFLEWCRFTRTPDEHFWHTLHSTYANPHINAPGGYTGVYNKHSLAVFVSWSYEGYKCQGRNVHAICVYGVGDLPKLMEPKTLHYNFANKFFLELEPLTLECLENWIEYKVACPPEFDYEFYKRLPIGGV